MTELMDEEQKMVRDIKGLDSDMQTLVYENYNKFISATDTIRKVIRVNLCAPSHIPQVPSSFFQACKVHW